MTEQQRNCLINAVINDTSLDKNQRNNPKWELLCDSLNVKGPKKTVTQWMKVCVHKTTNKIIAPDFFSNQIGINFFV